MPDQLKRLIQSETLLASLVLVVLLNLLFFPVIWGDKTLIHSAGDAASIMPDGAYKDHKVLKQGPRSNDDGAPAWFSEPSYALLHHFYFDRCIAPLWNPFNGYGVPLLANMQSQPLNPLVLIAALHPGPRGDDLFVLARLLLAGILTNTYLRLFVGRYGAIFGAIAFMLTGYFVMFLNMPEISVSMWLPGLICGLELLVRTPRFSPVVTCSFFTAMVLLGGMPEVSFLVLLVGMLYFLTRVFAGQMQMPEKRLALLLYALSNFLGLALAAPQILPFIEYVKESFNSHQGPIGPGAVFHSNFFVHFLNYLEPLIYGPLGSAKVVPGVGYDGFNGYWGVIVFSFALIAILVAVQRLRTKEQDDYLQKIMPIVRFFIAIVILFLGKRFGLPLVQWLGDLPLFRLVIFWKYSEPIIGFAMAVLSAVGFDLLVRGKLGRRTLMIGFALAASTLVAVGLFDKRFLWGDHQVHVFFNRSLTISICMICAALLISMFGIAKSGFKPRSARLLLLLLWANLSFSFVLPMFYWLHQVSSRDSDPYQGAPYIRFLETKLTNAERVLGFDGLLFPNWSSAFQIQDVRDLDAMYPARYLTFVRNFFSDKEPQEIADNNLSSRFHGMEKLLDPLFAKADSTLLKRFWYLSSIRYLLATRDHFIGRPGEITNKILAPFEQMPGDYLRLDAFTIGKQTKHVLFQHPHGDKLADTLKYECVISPERPWLNFSIAMDPATYDIAYGDGVNFSIHMVTPDGEKEVFSRYIDPKSRLVDRRWFPEKIDLSKFVSNKPVTLLFRIDAGPSNNTSGDGSGWADLRFSAGNQSSVQSSLPEAPELAYDKEIKIYKLSDALPRASLFYDFVVAEDSTEALNLLKSLSFDVTSKVVLESDEVPSGSISNGLANFKAEAQTIQSYDPLAVKILVQAEHPGILMLNDTFYPGWNAYIDGKRTAVFHCDYLFRAVQVKEGSHEVVFKYEPLSFTIGLWSCALSILGLGLYWFFKIRLLSQSKA